MASMTAASLLSQLPVSSSNSVVECSSSGSYSRRFGWIGVGALQCCRLVLDRPRRSCRARSNLVSVSAELEGEEVSVGAFCPLYSDRPSVPIGPGRRRKSVRMTSSRKSQINSLDLAVDGDIRVPAVRTTEEVLARIGKVSRVTKETNVEVELNLDGTGICDCDTGIPFLDHMLDQLASHGLLDVKVKAKGDLHIDDHHTNEDIGLAVGTALLQALGDRKGIYRFGDFSAPLDEALIHVVLDLSGRPYLGYDVEIPTQRVGMYDTQLVEHFFQSLVNTSGMTLHIRKLAGKNSHHIIEATFKAFARALRQALDYDIRRKGSVPSSKGLLSRA